MKRSIITVFVLLFAFAVSAMPVGAVDMVEPVGEVYAPFVNTPPVLDGILSEGEWNENAAFILSDWNNKSVVASGFTDVTPGWSSVFHLAWDNDYLYFAAETTDPDLCGRIEGTEGDYYRMYIDFGPTVMAGGMDTTCSFAFCLNEDENGSLETQSLLVIDPTGVVEGTGFGTKVDLENKLWVYEGKLPWSELLKVFADRTGVSITPAVGLSATALIYYADFTEGRVLSNWFGTTVSGYEAATYFGPEEYGIEISFVGADETIPARPETTFPVVTEPDDSTGADESVSEETGETSSDDTQKNHETTDNSAKTDSPTTTRTGGDGEDGSVNPIIPLLLLLRCGRCSLSLSFSW